MTYIKTIIIFLVLSMAKPVYGQEDARPYKSKLKQTAMEFGESNWHIFKQGIQYQGDGIVRLDIDVSPLPSGIYMVQALLEDGSIVTKRVIKK